MSFSNVHIVVVTYNRSLLLRKVLSNLITFPKNITCIHVCNNASTDDTEQVITEFLQKDPRIKKHSFNTNIGGAGGFSKGMEYAIGSGASWVGLMDDDVLIAAEALNALEKFSEKYSVMSVCRENNVGELSEFAAIKYNLKNPFCINPKVRSVLSFYKTKENCPEIIEIECASFEGFFIHSSIVERIGVPRAEYFIYGDDFDYCLRLRANNIKIACVRDALGVRMLPYKKSKFNSWKTYYIWRNFFVLHFVFGENLFVRLKPFALTLGLLVLSFIKQYQISGFTILRDAISIADTLKKQK